jgi:uncharacterized protein YndB with AHSA1/START domain
MATDLIHRIRIAAPEEKIYRAITTEGGISGWWTTNGRVLVHPQPNPARTHAEPARIE